MQSYEEIVLAGLVPDPGVFPNVAVAQASVVEPLLTAPCPDHGLVGCAVCGERIRRAREVSEARLKQSAQPTPDTVPDAVQPQQGSAKPNVEPEIIALARRLAGTQDQLAREEKLLITAQLRVEHLHASIAELKTAAEDARSRLVAYLAAEK